MGSRKHAKYCILSRYDHFCGPGTAVGVMCACTDIAFEQTDRWFMCICSP